VDKYELVERYEALGDENDFLAARRLFEQDLTGRSGALDRRQYGYLLECHGRRALRRAVEQYERAMALDPDQDKVQYQWMHAKAALGEPEDVITRFRNRVAGPASPAVSASPAPNAAGCSSGRCGGPMSSCARGKRASRSRAAASSRRPRSRTRCRPTAPREL
jgi:hypothetical protein